MSSLSWQDISPWIMPHDSEKATSPFRAIWEINPLIACLCAVGGSQKSHGENMKIPHGKSPIGLWIWTQDHRFNFFFQSFIWKILSANEKHTKHSVVIEGLLPYDFLFILKSTSGVFVKLNLCSLINYKSLDKDLFHSPVFKCTLCWITCKLYSHYSLTGFVSSVQLSGL